MRYNYRDQELDRAAGRSDTAWARVQRLHAQRAMLVASAMGRLHREAAVAELDVDIAVATREAQAAEAAFCQAVEAKRHAGRLCLHCANAGCMHCAHR